MRACVRAGEARRGEALCGRETRCLLGLGFSQNTLCVKGLANCGREQRKDTCWKIVDFGAERPRAFVFVVVVVMCYFYFIFNAESKAYVKSARRETRFYLHNDIA